MRVLLPLPVTIKTSPAPGKGTSRRFNPSASEMRRPEPYSSAITAASRAQIQGSRVSPARSSASVKRLAAAIWIGFGRLLPTLGARIAGSAPTFPRPLRGGEAPKGAQAAQPPHQGPPADIAGTAHRHEGPDIAGLKRCELR